MVAKGSWLAGVYDNLRAPLPVRRRQDVAWLGVGDAAIALLLCVLGFAVSDWCLLLYRRIDAVWYAAVLLVFCFPVAVWYCYCKRERWGWRRGCLLVLFVLVLQSISSGQYMQVPVAWCVAISGIVPQWFVAKLVLRWLPSARSRERAV